MAMGRHLRLFGMDFPPFMAILSEVSRLLGDSRGAVRLMPALAAALLVVLAGLLAREFGGKRFGQLLAALARAAVVVVVLAFGAVVAPFGSPILPPDVMARYAARMGVTAAVTTNRGEMLPLPQDYADMLGWEALAATVARIYAGLSPAVCREVVLVTENYGEAGVLDFFGARYTLRRRWPLWEAPGSSGPGRRAGAKPDSLGRRRGRDYPACNHARRIIHAGGTAALVSEIPKWKLPPAALEL